MRIPTLRRAEGRAWVERDRFIVCAEGDRVKCFAFLKVDAVEDEYGYEGGNEFHDAMYHSRIKSFFAGLYKTDTPFIYLVMARPIEKEFFQYEFYLGTWAEGERTRLEEVLAKVDQQAYVINTAMTVANPRCLSRRVEDGDLEELSERTIMPRRRSRDKVSAEELAKNTPLSVGSLGSGGRMIPPEFHVPAKQENQPGGVRLGSLISGGVRKAQFYLDLEDVSRHACILGMTGSGKTTTAKLMAKRLWERGVSFLVLDTHNEYASFAGEVGAAVVAPGKDEFILNPLDPMNAKDLSEHAALVTDIFADIYRFTNPQAFQFRGAVLKLLSEPERASGLRRDISGLVEAIESFPIKSAYDNETKLALLRRLIPLTEGQGGRSLCGRNTIDMNEVLSRPTVVELGHFRDSETRTIFSSFLLKAIYDYRVSATPSPLKHALFIEEARNLVPARRPEDPPTVTEKLSGELRKFGEAVVYIAQFPSQVSFEAIKNTGVKICHRMSWVSDTRLMGDAMNLNQEQVKYLSCLAVGEAIVGVSRLQSSVLVDVDAEDVLPSAGAPRLRQEEAKQGTSWPLQGP